MILADYFLDELIDRKRRNQLILTDCLSKSSELDSISRTYFYIRLWMKLCPRNILNLSLPNSSKDVLNKQNKVNSQLSEL